MRVYFLFNNDKMMVKNKSTGSKILLITWLYATLRISGDWLHAYPRNKQSKLPYIAFFEALPLSNPVVLHRVNLQSHSILLILYRCTVSNLSARETRPPDDEEKHFSSSRVPSVVTAERARLRSRVCTAQSGKFTYEYTPEWECRFSLISTRGRLRLEGG